MNKSLSSESPMLKIRLLNLEWNIVIKTLKARWKENYNGSVIITNQCIYHLHNRWS